MRLVGRFEADAVLLLEEPLQGRLAFVVADGDDLAVAGLLLAVDDDVVAVGDVLLDHRVARDAEGELVVGPFPLGEGQLLVLLDGLDRRSGGDPAEHLHPRGRRGGRVVEELDRPRHVRLAVDQPLLLQRLEVAHHPVGALDLELEADLTDGRAVPASLDLAANEAVNLALT